MSTTSPFPVSEVGVRALLGLRSEPPPVVAGYELLGEIGDGGYGVVYRARDPKLERLVALKITAGEQDLDEARALAQIHHPNVVTVFDVGADRGRTWMAMELVRGREFGEWVHGRSPGEVLEVLHQVARGLAAIHEAGLKHGDVKPSNILVDKRGRAVIIDLGMARVEGPVGTMKWAAPEVRAGRPADHRSDQYSFGLLVRWALETAGKSAIANKFAERATEEDPAKRWKSIEESMAMLPGGPRRRWVIAAWIASVVIAVLATWAIPATGGGSVVPEWATAAAMLLEARNIATEREREREAFELADEAAEMLMPEHALVAAVGSAMVADELAIGADTDQKRSLAAAASLIAAEAFEEAGDSERGSAYRRKAKGLMIEMGLSENQAEAIAGVR